MKEAFERERCQRRRSSATIEGVGEKGQVEVGSEKEGRKRQRTGPAIELLGYEPGCRLRKPGKGGTAGALSKQMNGRSFPREKDRRNGEIMFED
ncbi:hypothetical protein SDC9_205456 [bioreactor metagenome]|uniref:Uncharacterized protein n=1 Tax=bioreactor metagenome TaxID=1076179 RepID=A0A645J3S5_9ZZZZ